MTDRRFVPVVGLVGGIGSGKSAVARCLSERRTVAVIDGDDMGHQVLEQQDARDRIRERFGDTVFTAGGKIDRAALARVVFGPTADHQRCRAALESIVHPRIRSGFVKRIGQLRQSDGVDAILLDAAVLLEAGWEDLCDAVVFVDAPEASRLQRVVQNRGWTKNDLEKRLQSQFPLDVKRDASDFKIDNSGNLSLAADQLEEIIDRLAPQHPQ